MRFQEDLHAERNSWTYLHTTGATTAALLAGSCMPSWGKSRGARVLHQVEGQPPGPTWTHSRATPRSHPPGTFHALGRFCDTA